MTAAFDELHSIFQELVSYGVGLNDVRSRGDGSVRARRRCLCLADARALRQIESSLARIVAAGPMPAPGSNELFDAQAAQLRLVALVLEVRASASVWERAA